MRRIKLIVGRHSRAIYQLVPLIARKFGSDPSNLFRNLRKNHSACLRNSSQRYGHKLENERRLIHWRDTDLTMPLRLRHISRKLPKIERDVPYLEENALWENVKVFPGIFQFIGKLDRKIGCRKLFRFRGHSHKHDLSIKRPGTFEQVSKNQISFKQLTHFAARRVSVSLPFIMTDLRDRPLIGDHRCNYRKASRHESLPILKIQRTGDAYPRRKAGREHEQGDGQKITIFHHSAKLSGGDGAVEHLA